MNDIKVYIDGKRRRFRKKIHPDGQWHHLVITSKKQNKSVVVEGVKVIGKKAKRAEKCALDVIRPGIVGQAYGVDQEFKRMNVSAVLGEIDPPISKLHPADGPINPWLLILMGLVLFGLFLVIAVTWYS